MASLSFNKIYSCFLGKINDFDIPNMDEEILNEVLLGYLKSTIAQPTINGIFISLTYEVIEEFDNVDMKDKISWDESMVNYQLKVSAADDELFVTELLARGMVVQWLEPQVKNIVNISQFFGGKEQKYYSQAQHLSELKDMLETEKNELGKYIRDRGSVYNPYLKGKYYG